MLLSSFCVFAQVRIPYVSYCSPPFFWPLIQIITNVGRRLPLVTLAIHPRPRGYTNGLYQDRSWPFAYFDSDQSSA